MPGLILCDGSEWALFKMINSGCRTWPYLIVFIFGIIIQGLAERVRGAKTVTTQWGGGFTKNASHDQSVT